MNNLLQKLGLIQVSDEKTGENEKLENDDKNYNVFNNEENGINDDDGSDNGFDDDVSCDNYLKNLDPKEWKNQDHYRILGLSKKRINATESQIKKSCKFI